MVFRTLKSALLLPFLLLAASAAAEGEATWTAKVVGGEVKPNASVKVAVEAELQPGWHLYALTQKEGGPIATTIEAQPPLKLEGKPTQEKPKRKQDENFGIEVEYFEGSARFEVPVKLGPEGQKGSLKVRFQLCNDKSCLPPSTVEVALAPVAKQTEPVLWSVRVASGAAKPNATVKLALTASLAPGWHLYSMRRVEGGPIATTIRAAAPLTLVGKVVEPKPIEKHDPNFDLDVQYFAEKATFIVPVKLGPGGMKGALTVRFQLCNDTSCLPPNTVEVPLGMVPRPATAEMGTLSGTSSTSDFDQSFKQAKSQGLLFFVGYSFSLGLLSLLTPCVFPMIPITVSYFSKQRQREGSGRGYAQPIAYCLGIVGSFTAFGLLVTIFFGASGIQTFATNPYVNLALAAVFIVLAFNLFGLYHLTLPSSFANRFSGHGKAGLAGPLLMGFAFTLTSFTCTAPFVGTVLVTAATGDILFPLVGMLAFSSAFALPFFLLALFPQFLARLPKSGAWLESTKAFMGFLELAAALKFLSNADLVWSTNLLSRTAFLGIWVVISLAAALFLLGWFRLPKVVIPPRMGPFRLGMAILTLGAAGFLIAGTFGRSLGELEAFLPPGKSGWIEDFEKAKNLSRTLNRPLLVNFTGVTCTNCRWMEKNMFTRPGVVGELEGYVLAELYTDRTGKYTQGDARNQNLQRQLTRVVTLPVYVSLSPQGKVLKVFEGSTRSEEDFVRFLREARATALSARR